MPLSWFDCVFLFAFLLPPAVKMASLECHYEVVNKTSSQFLEEEISRELRQVHHTVPSTNPLDPKDSLFTTNDIFRSEHNFQIQAPHSDDPTVIETADSLSQIQYMPEVGNGHVATAMYSNSIFMNGLYNGASTTSHRARIPSSASYMIYGLPQGFKSTFTLDMGKGYYKASYAHDGVTVSMTTYAHRVFTGVIVNELTLSRDDARKTVDAFVHMVPSPPSVDIDFYNDTEGTVRGVTKVAEYPELASTITFYMKTSASLAGHHVMTPGKLTETLTRFTVVDVNKQKVLNDYDAAKKAFEKGTLLSSHVKEWEAAWQRGRIDVGGNVTLSRINYAVMYYLLSSLPFNGNRKDWPFVGLSPGGLAHGEADRDYMGHVFWDQDLWMSPGLAFLHGDIGKLLTETRTRTLKAAKLLAKRTGFQGVRYPWESAYTGLEVCPGKSYSDLEIHVTGDAVIMMRNYWYLTKDKTAFLDGQLYDVVYGAAEFFASRMEFDAKKGVYRIMGVMPPDEWHAPVDDSAFTNAVAKSVLEFANELSRAFGKPERGEWTKMANKLVIPYDKKLDYNPEYDGYKVGVDTKQADVVLLTYPLMIQLNESTRENNLKYYEKSTPVGPAPAMTWSIFLTIWLELGNENKAAELFHRSILNAQKPFYVWTENSEGSGATNFLTGMGGHLQSLIFGYGGCRFYEDHIAFDPKMIPSTTSTTFTGLDYMGCSFDVHYTDQSVQVTLKSVGQGSNGLEVKFSQQSDWQKLDLAQAVSETRQAFEIRHIQ